ncbi:MAG: acetamidase/formamidase family protein [Tissierellia bacterium]|nr:acetamidase/formamidase family protein [Tissierellia bacterium]
MFIKKDLSVFSMNRENESVLKAESGDTVVFETLDCFSEMVKTENDLIGSIDWTRINPATGPLYVEGAEVGDALKVDIVKISLAPQGVTIAAPGVGAIGEYIEKEETFVFPIEGDKISYKGIDVKLNPMIGVIGTAPSEDSIPTGTPYSHGGNMDCKYIKEGVSLYLPVNVEGGLLSIGDLHAAMGDGEINGAGVEISGQVEVKVSVVKDFKYDLPIIETEDKIMMLSSLPTMEEASKDCVHKMAKLLMVKNDFSINEAGMFLSIAGDLRVCQIVDPNMTMRMEVKKEHFRDCNLEK